MQISENTKAKLRKVQDLGVLSADEVQALISAAESGGGIHRKTITYKEAEMRTGLSRWTLLRAVKNGELSLYQVGTRRLFDLAELDEWLDSKKVTHL